MSKINELAEQFGFEDTMDMLEEAVMDSVVPAQPRHPIARLSRGQLRVR